MVMDVFSTSFFAESDILELHQKKNDIDAMMSFNETVSRMLEVNTEDLVAEETALLESLAAQSDIPLNEFTGNQGLLALIVAGIAAAIAAVITVLSKGGGGSVSYHSVSTTTTIKPSEVSKIKSNVQSGVKKEKELERQKFKMDNDEYARKRNQIIMQYLSQFMKSCRVGPTEVEGALFIYNPFWKDASKTILNAERQLWLSIVDACSGRDVDLEVPEVELCSAYSDYIYQLNGAINELSRLTKKVDNYIKLRTSGITGYHHPVKWRGEDGEDPNEGRDMEALSKWRYEEGEEEKGNRDMAELFAPLSQSISKIKSILDQKKNFWLATTTTTKHGNPAKHLCDTGKWPSCMNIDPNTCLVTIRDDSDRMLKDLRECKAQIDKIMAKDIKPFEVGLQQSNDKKSGMYYLYRAYCQYVREFREVVTQFHSAILAEHSASRAAIRKYCNDMNRLTRMMYAACREKYGVKEESTIIFV